MKTMAIMNLKGGVGKTVTAINVGAILARDYEQRVLFVDADSQASLTEFVTASLPEIERGTAGGLADVLRYPKAGSIIRKTSLENADLLPASDELMELDISSAGSGTVDVMALQELRERLEDEYEWMIIDCPPAFSASAMAALIAADSVLIPMKLDAFGIRGMSNLVAQVRNMQKVNPGLKIDGILPTMFYNSAKLREAEQLLRSSGLPVFSHIRRSTKVDEMTFAQTPIIHSSPRSCACVDYRQFVREFLEGGASHGV